MHIFGGGGEVERDDVVLGVWCVNGDGACVVTRLIIEAVG